MKTLIAFVFLIISGNAFPQSDTARVLEQRARNFHSVISKYDKAEWRRFMSDNFTKTLIERPMRAQVSTSENDGMTQSKTSEAKLEEKFEMFERLHQDFGKSTISSIKVTGNVVSMRLTTDSGLLGIFRLEATKTSPWQIDKMGIEVEAGN